VEPEPSRKGNRPGKWRCKISPSTSEGFGTPTTRANRSVAKLKNLGGHQGLRSDDRGRAQKWAARNLEEDIKRLRHRPFGDVRGHLRPVFPATPAKGGD